METVRMGVIGTSWWMETFHLRAIQSHPGAHLKAICGRRREPAEELAMKYDCDTVYTDYEAMLNTGTLDAVIIASPDDLHYPMTMLALEQPLHVICEKPFARSADQAREMYEKAEAAGVKNMVMFLHRGFPIFAYLKQLIEDGYLGELYHGHWHWITNWFANPNDEYWWFFDSNRSRGVISGVGSHMIDLAHWYFGDIRSVSANLSTFVDRSTASDLPQDVNDAGIILAEFAKGAYITIHCSTVSRLAEGIKHQGQVMILHGSEGTLEVHADLWSASPPTTKIIGYRRGADSSQVLDIPPSFYGASDRDVALDVFMHNSLGTRLFIDSILNDMPIEPSFEHGYRVERVIDAAIQSHESNRKISL
jgi:predicted dehydrogenase